jgi:hypothetical protein
MMGFGMKVKAFLEKFIRALSMLMKTPPDLFASGLALVLHLILSKFRLNDTSRSRETKNQDEILMLCF